MNTSENSKCQMPKSSPRTSSPNHLSENLAAGALSMPPEALTPLGSIGG
jgi:hypothetical protein